MKKILDKDDYKQLNIIDVTGLFEYIVINDSSLSLEDELMMIISAIKGELDVSGEFYLKKVIKKIKILKQLYLINYQILLLIIQKLKLCILK